MLRGGRAVAARMKKVLKLARALKPGEVDIQKECCKSSLKCIRSKKRRSVGNQSRVKVSPEASFDSWVKVTK